MPDLHFQPVVSCLTTSFPAATPQGVKLSLLLRPPSEQVESAGRQCWPSPPVYPEMVVRWIMRISFVAALLKADGLAVHVVGDLVGRFTWSLH
jgi:hypothetical protein